MGVLGASSNVLGGVFKATASGAIANGKACRINSDGTVSQAAAKAGCKIFIGESDRVREFRLKNPFDPVDGGVFIPDTGSGSYGSFNTANTAGTGYGTQYYTAIQERESGVQGIAFNADGTKFFTTGSSGDDVNEYTLSTAYDLGTLSFVDSYDISAKTTSPGGLDFKPDGTEMYVSDTTDKEVHQWTLSTAFDVSTASFTNTYDTSRDDNIQGIRFKPDGTKMFTTTNNSDRTDQFTLSTAWDLSTASFDSVSLDHSSYNTNVYDLIFNNDGTKLFLLGNSAFELIEYALSTAYDLSTASFTQETYLYATYNTSIIFGGGMAATDDNYIGISQGSFSDGDTAIIKTMGNIDTNQSGLTPNAPCYIDGNGAITSTDTKFVAGQALSATTVLIKSQQSKLFD